MEETLTDCLVRVREDLNQLKRVRDYLDTNTETEERCSVTWRTIEAFNSILSVCSSQNTPETNALDTLLDSFYYLARNNKDDTVWDDFGFELGIICVRVLSAIERTEIFEILFCKLLSVISIISEYNSNVWKAAGRQILNVLINKKVSLSYLEAILKLYICILKNIDSSALHDFSSQNLHLLKTLSLLVQKVGDFEIQSDVIELIFLHLSKETKLMSDFFSSIEKNLIHSLQFNDFENDCRLYLNTLNKPRRGFERKVHSICCHVLYLGGCFVEPPIGKNCIWVDANKDSERLSIRCGDIDSNENRVIYIQFSEILSVQLENDKTEGHRCLTVQTKTLLGVQKDVKNDDICMVVDNTEEVYHFMDFLEAVITTKKKKLGRKSSKTMDCLFIDRNNPKVQDNSVTSSERPGIDQILPDALSLFERSNQAINIAKSSRLPKPETKTPPKTPGVVLESQELSPNSFAESLNKHIGLGSPEIRNSFEDSVETIEFLQKTTPGGRKLFRSPDKIFDIQEPKDPTFNFIFEEDKENQPEVPKSNIKTYSRKIQKPTRKASNVLVLKQKKEVEINLMDTQSQDYFHNGSTVVKKKKPSLPKLKRNGKESTKTTNLRSSKNHTEQIHRKKEHNTIENKSTQPNSKEKETEILNKPGKAQEQQQTEKTATKHLKRHEKQLKSRVEKKQTAKSETKPDKNNTKPSLLDPKGYAYQRWCQPTTSERSNFWLKKLQAAQKPKTTTETVFDFSDDSVISEVKSKKRSKPKYKTRTKHTTLRQVKEIIKKSPTKAKPTNSPPKKQTKVPKRIETPPKTPEPTKDSLFNPPPSPRKSTSSESEQPAEDADAEYESLSDDEEPPPQTKKREHSDSSTTKRHKKKKQKTNLPKNLLATLRLRLQKIEEKDKRSTDEIIQTINKATDHLLVHLHRKNGDSLMSYLNVAEAATAAFTAETDELLLRAKRVQRAILYFKAGCSVSDSRESLEATFSRVRAGLNDLKESRESWKVVERIGCRLNEVIKSEIDRLVKSEWESKRSRLLRCASILGISVGSLQL